MSKTRHIINLTCDRELLEKVRGNVPLRNKQIHQDKREKRGGNKWWKDQRNWDE